MYVNFDKSSSENGICLLDLLNATNHLKISTNTQKNMLQYWYQTKHTK